jgi:HSP20 family protein
MNSDQYFENLANGKINAEAEEVEETGSEKKELEMGTYEAGGEFEVELAKATTGAVATRSTKTAHAKAAEWDEDGEPEGQLTVDVYQTANDIIIESAIAGVKPDDIDVSVTTDSISIRGARRHEQEVKDGDYLYQECYWGRFARSLILPQEIDPDHAEVSFKNGILTIRLPKTDKKKSKKLRVRVD